MARADVIFVVPEWALHWAPLLLGEALLVLAVISLVAWFLYSRAMKLKR